MPGVLSSSTTSSADILWPRFMIVVEAVEVTEAEAGAPTGCGKGSIWSQAVVYVSISREHPYSRTLLILKVI